MSATRSSSMFVALVLAGAGAALTAPVAAQDVTYETVTKTELPGALGTAVRFAARLGGGSMEVVERTSIKGKRMRVDVDNSSTITDLENGRMIILDHDAKTYMSFTFDEMIQRAQQAVGEAHAVSDERTETAGADPSTRMQFSFSVDDAGQREKVAGYDAQRFFLTMQAETEYIPEGESQFEKGGTLVVFTDMWTSKGVPVLDARGAFDQATAQEYAQASASLTQGIAAAFADDPQLAVAFEKSVEEASKIEGVAVRTDMHFVMVAPGEAFNRTAITDPPQRGGVRQAARGGLGRLAARAAGARGQQEEQPQDEPTQGVVLTVKSELRNISTKSVDAKLFEIPDGYREIDFQD